MVVEDAIYPTLLQIVFVNDLNDVTLLEVKQ